MGLFFSKPKALAASYTIEVPQQTPHIVIKAPYSDKDTYSIKIQNRSGRRVAVRVAPERTIKLYKNDKFMVNGNEDVEVTFHGFAPRPGHPTEKIVVEWVNVPDDAGKSVKLVWFNPDLPSFYNKNGEYIHTRDVLIGYEAEA